MKIVLIGFMGSGKSTVAKALSKLLGLDLVEMDELVCQKTNAANMHEIFARGGELLLRETEIAVAKEITLKRDLVVSTGGGVPLNKIILDYFKEEGAKVVFLNAGFEKIVERLEGDFLRPLFANRMEAKKMYDFRLPLYINYADEVVEVDSYSPDQIAGQIKELIHGF